MTNPRPLVMVMVTVQSRLMGPPSAHVHLDGMEPTVSTVGDMIYL